MIMKNSVDLLLVLLILGILLTLIQTSQLPADTLTPNQIAKKARDSMVFIVSILPGGNFISSGSGFFVESNKIATNIHVVDSEIPKIKQVGTETWYTIEGVTAFDAKYDLVILQIAEEGIKLPLGDSNAAQVGDPILAIGTPARGNPSPKREIKVGRKNTESEIWHALKGEIIEGEVKEITISGIRTSDKQLIQLEPSLPPGYSGGPVLNCEGKVIGVSIESIENDSGSFSYAIPSSVLEPLLDRSSKDTHPEPLSKWRKRDPIRGYILYTQGYKKYLKDDFDGAATDLRQAIALNSECELSYLWLANTYLDRGVEKYNSQNYNGAIADYTKIINGFPDSPKVIKELIPKWHIAAAYFNRGNAEKVGENSADYDAAIKDYDKALIRLTEYFKGMHDDGLKPDFTDFTDRVYCDRGLTKFLLGKHEEIQGNEGKAHNLYEEAIKDCSEANVRSKDAQSYYYLGLAYEAQRKNHLAHENFTIAKELDPDNFLSWEQEFERYRIR